MLSPADHFEEIEKNLKPFYSSNYVELSKLCEAK